MSRKNTVANTAASQASNAWLRTIGQLDGSYASRMSLDIARLSRQHLNSNILTDHLGIAVSVIDRTSSQTASVSWSDPQGCRYGDQVWRIAIARQSGVCVLSGKPIHHGDQVYRPRKAEPPPANADAMILAVELDAATAENESRFNAAPLSPSLRAKSVAHA